MRYCDCVSQRGCRYRGVSGSLESVYGIRFAEFVPQRTLAFTAEALRRGQIDAGLLFSTAPELADPEPLNLEDDRGMRRTDVGRAAMAWTP